MVEASNIRHLHVSARVGFTFKLGLLIQVFRSSDGLFRGSESRAVACIKLKLVHKPGAMFNCMRFKSLSFTCNDALTHMLIILFRCMGQKASSNVSPIISSWLDDAFAGADADVLNQLLSCVHRNWVTSHIHPRGFGTQAFWSFTPLAYPLSWQLHGWRCRQSSRSRCGA